LPLTLTVGKRERPTAGLRKLITASFCFMAVGFIHGQRETAKLALVLATR
jgi:hypothetical protein